MSAKRVLCVGRMQPVMDGVLQQLRDAGYEAQGAIDDDGVVAIAAREAFDALVIGGGVSEDDRAELHERVTAIQPHIIVIQVTRGPQSVVEEVRSALP
jgi:DNA-binding NtrC family response regulator